MSNSKSAVATSQTPSNSKIIWLSIVQGWAILLVIIGHANTLTYADAGSYPTEVYPLGGLIHRFCYSFHMPLFMFVSGGLLYFTRIKRGFSTKALYVDKLKRLLLPYIFFTIVAIIVKVIASSVVKRGVDFSLSGILEALFNPGEGPMAELWFVGTLLWLMALYPLYRAALKGFWTELILLSVTLVAFIFADNIDIRGWFSLKEVFTYAFFFVGGILYFKYAVYRWFEKRLWTTLLVTAIFFATFIGELPLIFTAIPGILMSIAWAVTLVDRFPKMFSWFRDYSYQIFLLGLFPQMFLELIVWTKYHDEWLQLPYILASTVAAILFAVLVAKIGERVHRPAWIRWLIGLK